MAPELSVGTAPALEKSTLPTLPPLILHPFADAGGPSKLVESSRANLKLQGLLPSGESSRDDLDRALLEGRFSELRMLYYVGKDLARWIEQCLEFAVRNESALPRGIRFQTFAALLIQDPPSGVQVKLRKWGVGDYKSIFGRALGLHTLFAVAPPREVLSDEFVRSYYRFADQIFQSKQSECDFTPLTSRDVHFELYSSGEYSRMLERSWTE